MVSQIPLPAKPPNHSLKLPFSFTLFSSLLNNFNYNYCEQRLAMFPKL
jgi:hypothetical protein